MISEATIAVTTALAVAVGMLIRRRWRWGRIFSCSHSRHHQSRFPMLKITGLLGRFFEHSVFSSSEFLSLERQETIQTMGVKRA